MRLPKKYCINAMERLMPLLFPLELVELFQELLEKSSRSHPVHWLLESIHMEASSPCRRHSMVLLDRTKSKELDTISFRKCWTEAILTIGLSPQMFHHSRWLETLSRRRGCSLEAPPVLPCGEQRNSQSRWDGEKIKE